jgi:ABC-type multidrug transport system fused ATPase/permease subunit
MIQYSLGENGKETLGGEIQMLALIRLALKKPNMLIMMKVFKRVSN